MIARTLSAAGRTIATVGLLGALVAPAAATPVPAPSPTPGPAVKTLVTDACPHKQVPPPAVDASEVPKPGQPAPSPLPVPDPPVGGEKLSGCGLVVPDGAPPVPPGIDSAGWLVADATDGAVVAAKDPHGRYRPASTIKLLLAQVALRDLDLDTVVEGTAEDDGQEGDAAGVAPGGRYTVKDLLEGLLLISGNDTAHALARQLGGVDEAVRKMNKLAASLGARDTRAATPSGLDGPGMSSSPYDMALILRAALQDKRFVEIASTRRITFPGHPPVPTTAPATPLPPGASPPPSPTSVAPYPIVNENRLLTDFPGAVAGKNGYTDDAKKTFVGAVDRDGHRYIIVQMFGLSHTGNTYWDQYRRLLDYGVALRGKSVGTLVSSEATPPASEHGGETETVVESGPSGMGNGTRLLIGLGGLAVIAALVGAAMRTNRSR
ncbi:D-alanyl-D-alanine carboxypeptidase family protein [Tsukamurella sp. PLM1]|uniref:D-alanyl-D-alanine carboxypeptidase family protein n=1 Tax=Tsukamurella sp. PLM1 TaxID=2929795 RepID=UPI002046CAA4|nr:serine hydrolase [Tsukamurella sp. PLM1]BDH58822.1 D-alanyl-D-alanine carboxypeptidase [Tsukamurella sp. PLM1]